MGKWAKLEMVDQVSGRMFVRREVDNEQERSISRKVELRESYPENCRQQSYLGESSPLECDVYIGLG